MTKAEAPNVSEQMKGAEAPYERAVVDDDGSKWAEAQENIATKYKHIIALRGAGTNNGIDKAAANKLVDEQLVPRIQKYMQDGPVALMFDGDGDDLSKPDIGFIMGRLRDAFGSEVEDKITFVAAQKKSWYYPPKEGGNLGNASGREYKTTVFPDGKFAGDHNSFTQSQELANAPGYEQWYIGASGPIASEQLEDLNSKVQEGTRKVTMFRAPINGDLGGVMADKLKQAQEAGDIAKIKKFEDVIAQRQNTYGVHFDNEGNFSVDREQYGKLEFEVV